MLHRDLSSSSSSSWSSRWSAIAGSLVLASALAFVALSPTTTTGCATQETSESPDAALPPCKRGPFIFCGNNNGPCQPVGPDVEGCNTSDGTGPLLSELPRNRYPLGTVVDYVGQRDEQNNCKLDAVCKCQIGNLIAKPFPTDDDAGGDDAGTGDAGDGGDAGDADVVEPDEAGTAPTPVDAGIGPVWSCYP